ncbi:MAG: GNAT family N-acetyltransferase [Planctomycetes bacterium]|nr:GNAT family N-acetyltransferase [Planctomycetota bacterium]
MTDPRKVNVVRAGLERLDEVEPLWRSLFDHHAAISPPSLGPLHPYEQAWHLRRNFYESGLKGGRAFLLVAEISREVVGYAYATIQSGHQTWQTGERMAELETLAVLPAERSRGVGTALLNAFYDELRLQGIRDFSVAVLITNDRAIKFYGRQKLIPFTTHYLGKVPEI